MKLSDTIVVSALFGLASAAAAEPDFERLDADGDGSISRAEYDLGMRQSEVYANFDTDRNDLIDENEYDEIGLDSEFEDWDANRDAYLDDDEFYESTFGFFDDNEDGHWDGGEWDDAGDAGFWDV